MSASTGTYMDKAFVRLDKAIQKGRTRYGICNSKPCRGCKRKDRWEGE